MLKCEKFVLVMGRLDTADILVVEVHKHRAVDKAGPGTAEPIFHDVNIA